MAALKELGEPKEMEPVVAVHNIYQHGALEDLILLESTAWT